MRTIKFRAFDVDNKWMIPDFDNWVDFSGGYWTTPDRTYDTPNVEIVKKEGVILMQYTGLHDKNGKEIYEGDIVKGTSENPGGPSEVFYDYGVWQPFNFLGIYDGTKYEVIGDIYQNPELLEIKSK